MREIRIEKNDAGQRLDKFLQKSLSIPKSLMYRYIRLKRIKRNGARAQIGDKLNEGDLLTLYISDEFFTRVTGEEYLKVRGEISVLFEDDNLLLVDKPAGMSVHEDESGNPDTLIANIQRYLYEDGKWDPKTEQSFVPALVNRIDRNTRGIVLAAKNAEALRVLNEKMKSREIRKFYLAAAHGELRPPSGTLTGYLLKDPVKKEVTVLRHPAAGAKLAKTKYHTIQFKKGISFVECELLTGRTHQIRAQFAAAGHPLVGDRKYGTTALNKATKLKGQALLSYRVFFDFTEDAGILNYLRGRSFELEPLAFFAVFSDPSAHDIDEEE